MPPLVSLVSGTYNRLPLLQAMVESFRTNIPVGVDYEIILVDGGSTDGTLEWCAAQPDVHLVEHGALKGAILAFTDGAVLAQGKYTLLANDDVVFWADSVMAAVVHLENNLKCGAVAFQDNRVIPGYTTTSDYHTLKMPADRNGAPEYVTYAQVGLFRTWLGQRIGWWLGSYGEMSMARIYGGDNFLSAKIWELGYTVEEAVGARVNDLVHPDDLRRINSSSTKDSDTYYGLWKSQYKGPSIAPFPMVDNPDSRQVRVLYLPIFEPGYAHQRQTKRGLREALKRGVSGKPFIVWEFDYLAVEPARLEETLMTALRLFRPHILLTQIQSPAPFTPQIANLVRQEFPYVTWVNWNGDESMGGLASRQILDIVKRVDLQLIVNMKAAPIYAAHNIRAAYWQVGFEPVDEPLPDMPWHPVVWLASLYNQERLDVAQVVRDFGGAIYQPGTPPETLYRFDRGRALYRNALIGIGTNEYADSEGFVSNRLFEALAAGGCAFFQQRVLRLEELTGIRAGVHYVEWVDAHDLRQKLEYYLKHEDERRAIADAGHALALKQHSFDARLKELFALMKGRLTADRQSEETVLLEYIGPRKDAFGAGRGVVTGKHYEYQPGYPLIVDKRDAAALLQHKETWKVSE